MWFAALARGGRDVWALTAVFTALTLLLVAFLIGRSRDHLTLRFPAPLLLSVSLAGLWITLAGSYDRNATVLECWGWTFAAVGMWLAVNSARDQEGAEALFRLVGWSLAPVAGVALWQQITGHSDSWGYWRIYSTLANPSVLAGFCLPWFVLDASGLSEPRSRWRFACAAVGLLLSRSFGAIGIACLAVGWAHRAQVVSWLRPRRWLTWSLVAMTVLGGAFLVYRKLSVASGPYKGSSRLYYWTSGLRMAREHPILGVGAGAFAAAFPSYRTGTVQNTLFAHNLIVQTVAEAGLVGVLLLIAWLMTLFRPRIDPNNEPFRVAVGASLLYGMTGIHLNFWVNQMVLALFLARLLGSQALLERPVPPLRLLTAALASMLLVPLWARVFVGERLTLAGIQFYAAGQREDGIRRLKDAVDVDSNNALAFWVLSKALPPGPEADADRKSALARLRSESLLDQQLSAILHPRPFDGS